MLNLGITNKSNSNKSMLYTKLDFNWSQYILLTPPLGMPKFDIKWFTRFITIAFICNAQI
jgi:hypothetical protein